MNYGTDLDENRNHRPLLDFVKPFRFWFSFVYFKGLNELLRLTFYLQTFTKHSTVLLLLTVLSCVL
jgi:hypothetical protein